jgi:hypothetical protein
MQQTRAVPSANLDAVVERITYANQETGYTVARVATGRSGGLLTVVGPLLGAQPGERLRLRGRWASHPSTAASSRSRPTTPCCRRPSRGSAATSARDRVRWLPGCCACWRRRRPPGQLPGGGLDGRAGLAAPAHRRLASSGATSSGPVGPQRAGGGADRRARLRQELHRARRRCPGPGPSGPRSCWPPRPGGPPSAWQSWPGWRRPPCTGCCSCAPAGTPPSTATTPLDAELVVVDEASMLDVLLANKLIRAIPPGAHLLLVGDVDQLPSVGAGEVLRDLPAAERLPRVRLTKLFRQAQRSAAVTNTHRINAGQPPTPRGLADCFLFAEDDPERVADLVVDVVADRLPRRFGLDPGASAAAVPDAPGTSWRRRAERAAPGRADPRPRGAGRAPLRRPRLPGRRQGHAAPQRLRQGHRRGRQRLGRGRSPRCRWRTASCGCCWTRTRRWPTASTSWTG